jgi:hypothetical protein
MADPSPFGRVMPLTVGQADIIHLDVSQQS